MYVESDLAFDLGGNDAFDLRRMCLAFGYGALGFRIRLASDVVCLVMGLHPDGLCLRLQGLFARLGDDRALGLYLFVCGFCHRMPPR